MKIASTAARHLLGLIFFVFGLNEFLHFIPTPPPAGVAGQFFAALYLSHYLVVIFLLQLIPAILLLLNRYVPRALTLLGPIVVNILFFHSRWRQADYPWRRRRASISAGSPESGAPSISAATGLDLWVDRNLPTRSMRLCSGKSCVLVPTFVTELVRTIRQNGPGQWGDRIDHLPKLLFRTS